MCLPRLKAEENNDPQTWALMQVGFDLVAISKISQKVK